MQFTGKTIEEAITLALSETGLTKEQAVIIVIEEPTKGLFGKLKGKAVVDVTPIEEEKTEVKEEQEVIGKEEEERAVKFVQGVLDIMGLNAKAELSNNGENTVISLISEDSSSIIGYRGEVLDAIQTLAGAAANIGKKDYKKVVVDCENYRERREETLIKLAHKLEEKATDMKREVILEPMSPYERRIIHTTLSESQTVSTKSEGKEPNRYVVIVPNDKDEFSKPYNAGRNGNDRGGRRGGNDRRNGRGGKDFKGAKRSGSGFTEQKKKTSISFGTYLGNSLKNND